MAHHADGRVLLLSAPLALFPGETVRAQVRWKARHGEGEVTEWLENSPDRREPGCPVASRCGGCQLRGAGSQTGELKRQMVADLFRRQLPEAGEWAWHPAPGAALRHRIQVHWDGRRLGFHARRSHDLVAVATCPAAAPSLNGALPALQRALAAGTLPPAPRWELVTGSPEGAVWASDGNAAWRLRPEGWVPDGGPVRHAWQGMELGHRPGGFFQVSPAWAFEAFGRVLEGWDLRGQTLYDLYGGVGFFSILLGTRFNDRILVESDAPAVELAKSNLEAAGLQGICHAEPVDTWIPETLGGPGDLILADPPRTGLSETVRQRLGTARADALILIGCDGAAFCRDVRALAPSWRLESLSVLDLFPHTSHVECVGRLVRV